MQFNKLHNFTVLQVRLCCQGGQLSKSVQQSQGEGHHPGARLWGLLDVTSVSFSAISLLLPWESLFLTEHFIFVCLVCCFGVGWVFLGGWGCLFGCLFLFLLLKPIPEPCLASYAFFYKLLQLYVFLYSQSHFDKQNSQHLFCFQLHKVFLRVY